MASIRNLKKNVNLLTYELLTEAFTYKHFHPGMNEKKFDDVILELVKLRNELISRINNREKFDSTERIKVYYRKIQNDMMNLVKVMDGLSK